MPPFSSWKFSTHMTSLQPPTTRGTAHLAFFTCYRPGESREDLNLQSSAILELQRVRGDGAGTIRLLVGR